MSPYVTSISLIASRPLTTTTVCAPNIKLNTLPYCLRNFRNVDIRFLMSTFRLPMNGIVGGPGGHVSFRLVFVHSIYNNNTTNKTSRSSVTVTDVLISYFRFALCLLIQSLPFQISGYAALVFTCTIAFNC